MSSTALIFSPHPDDECIVGGLALRLARESGWNILDVAVTLGSRKQRRTARLNELKSACRLLHFGLLVAGERGLESINSEARINQRRNWKRSTAVIMDILRRTQPRVVFVPHADDGHPTHIGTHWLVMDALKAMPRGFQCSVVETEFWRQMQNPNLLVGLKSAAVAELMAALSLHAGEVRRNPYHLRLPSWMMDNVRRSEIVFGGGSAMPDIPFGVLHRLREWKNGKFVDAIPKRKFLSCEANPALLFP